MYNAAKIEKRARKTVKRGCSVLKYASNFFPASVPNNIMMPI